MNYTLNWDYSEQAVILSFVYPFEISPGVQRESFEIYTKFQGYRALQAVIEQHYEHGYTVHPEEQFLLWKDIHEKIFFKEYQLQVFTDDDLVTIHECVPHTRKDAHEIKKMRVRTFLKTTVGEQLNALMIENQKRVRTVPRNKSGNAPGGAVPAGYTPAHS